MLRSNTRIAVLNIILSLAISGPATADWAENFDSSFDQVWTFAATDDVGDPPSTGSSLFTIVDAGVDDFLRISHSTTGFRDGGGGATDGFGFVSEVFIDVAVSAEINSDPLLGQQSLLGVFARGNPATGTLYGAGVNYAEGFFAIGRNDNVVDFLNPIAIDTLVPIDPNRPHIVQLWIAGSSLTARLIDATTSDVLSTLTATDSNYASGVSGVLVQTNYDDLDFPTGPIIGTFDRMRSVPEPAQISLLAAGIICLVGLSSVRKSRPV